MMHHSNHLIAAVLGMLLAGIATTASKVLQDFSRRELELYCRKRRRLDRFGEILDHYEEAELGLESLQVVGAATFAVAWGIWWHTLWSGPAGWEIGLAGASGAGILLIATNWLPEALARVWAELFLYHAWPLLRLTQLATWPLTFGVRFVAAVFGRLANRRHATADDDAFEDELRSVVAEGLHDGVLEKEQRQMIEGVIELGDTDVSQIMTPRSQIDALDAALGFDDIIRRVAELGRTRLPVFEGTIDNVIGVLYVKDLLASFAAPEPNQVPGIARHLRPAYLVPQTKPVDDMLQEFLRTRNHLAIVVDEYHSVTGVVTIEDVLEEIVGEIDDESDDDKVDHITSHEDGSFLVSGVSYVHEVNERLGADLPESDEYDTIAGLVMSRLGRIPAPGDDLEVDQVAIRVVAATRRTVNQVELRLSPPQPAANHGAT